MSEIKWIKITTDMFDDQKIRIIESMPDGDTMLVIWLKILTLAGKVNRCGHITLTEKIAYTDDMLATLFNRPIATLKLALTMFQNLEMIEIDEHNVISLVNWEKHQNIEGMERIREQTKQRVQKHRTAKSISNVTSNVTVTLGNATDKEEELDKELDKDIKTVVTVFQVYQNEIGILSSLIQDKLNDWLNEFDESIVIHAIHLAAESNARRWAYIDSILKSWSDKNARTLDDIKALQSEHKRKTKGVKVDGSSGQDVFSVGYWFGEN